MTDAEALANDGFEPVYNVKAWEFADDGKLHLSFRNSVTGESGVLGRGEPLD
jgi:hypothetical protein